MGEDGWTSEIQVHYPQVTETALAPDGTRVVYAVREALMTEEESKFISHLYLARVPDAGEDAGDAAPIRLTHGAHHNWGARWSPDGQYIAFVSDRGPDGKGNLYAMRADGGEPWALTAFDESSAGAPVWAPDGQSLVFTMVAPPTEAKAAARKAKDDAELWDEDFDFQYLYRVSFVTGRRAGEPPAAAVQLTTGRMHVMGADWMPDGERLAITYQPTPGADDWTKTVLAWLPATLPAAEEGAAPEPYGPDDLEPIAQVGTPGSGAMISPDGAWIACVTETQPVHWASENRIVLYPTDGGEPRPLPFTPDAQGWLIGWAADSRRVYAGDMAGLDTHVWALDADGAAMTPVLASESYKFAFARAAQDVLVFAEETFHRPNTVRAWVAGETHTVAAPPLPEDWPTAPLPEVEVLSWAAPDLEDADGAPVQVEGFVSYPPDYEQGTAVPLIVHVHGGPAGVFQRGFVAAPGRYADLPALTAAGFAVLQVNPRGSSGYGRDFRFANYGDWGQGDYRDLMGGVELLVARGVADPERLGIMGWSYGGYMTSWTITQTDRFKAACVGAGVTNLMSFTGTADIPGFLPDYFTGEFWDDLTAYRDHSALFNVQGVATPTLIQHGREDVRVPLSQGRELYNALKRQGAPVKMVIYPRQGHGIEEPRLRIDMRRRPVAWFRRWLLGAE